MNIQCHGQRKAGPPGVTITPRFGPHPRVPLHPEKEKETIVLGKSTKICPHCSNIRKREYGRSGPFTLVEVEYFRSHFDERVYGKPFPIRQPRSVSKKAWWNKGVIRWFLTPMFDSPYFFCWEKVQCMNPACIQKGLDYSLVEENCCYRQFIVIRRILFWVGSRVGEFSENIKHGFRFKKQH